MVERTLFIIKPDAIKRRKVGSIIDIIETNGFDIVELKLFTMNREMAETLYAIHQGKPYYEKLIDFMITDKIVAAVLERENAVTKLRTVVGSTDPSEAELGTIRHIFGTNVTLNAVHASDSPENAVRELSIIFPELIDS